MKKGEPPKSINSVVSKLTVSEYIFLALIMAAVAFFSVDIILYSLD